MDYAQVRVIGSGGPDKPLFDAALRGIVARPTGGLVAVGDSSVKLIKADGTIERQWSTDKSGHCVAINADGTIWVGEPGQIEKFDASGQRKDMWRDAERFGLVTSIGFSGEFVLVADAQDRCIRRFDGSGRWLNDIGKDNNTKGFVIPNGHLDFKIDGEGVIHAVNSAKHRIERYSLEGKMLGKFGHFGHKDPANFTGCCNPTNITLAPGGRTVVTEKAGPRLKIYDKDDKLLAFVAGETFDANCKNMDIAADAGGHIYVADTVKRTILVFAPKTGEAKPESSTQGAGTP